MKIVGRVTSKNWFTDCELALLKLAGYGEDTAPPTGGIRRVIKGGSMGPKAAIECCYNRDYERCFSADVWPVSAEDSDYIFNAHDLKKVIVHADNALKERGKP